jgi:hypothetical protein
LVGGCGMDSIGLGQGPLAGCCECGDEPSCSGATRLVKKQIFQRFLAPASIYCRSQILRSFWHATTPPFIRRRRFWFIQSCSVVL